MTTNYCTQNGGDCETCSLVNYGRDCQNNLVDGAAVWSVLFPNFCPGCGARQANYPAADVIKAIKRFNGGRAVVCVRCGQRVKKAGAA